MEKMSMEEMLAMIAKSGITVNGDLVLHKEVDKEIGNVEAGGIGIQINNGEQKPKASVTGGTSRKKKKLQG